MSERYTAADRVLAVQEGFSAATELNNELAGKSSAAILEALRDGRSHSLSELAKDAGLALVPTLEAVQQLRNAQLVELDDEQDAVALTAAGKGVAESH